MSSSVIFAAPRALVPFRRARLVATLAFVAVLASACTDASPTAPDTAGPAATPGTLLLQLAGTQPSDAAFQLEVRGVRVTDDITAARPEIQIYVRQRGDVWQVAVFGTSPNGELLRLRVPDVRELERYSARVTDVSYGDGALRSAVDLEAYRGTVRRMP